MSFGNVTDIDFDNWENEIKRIKPDIIYATQNNGIELLAYEVFRKNLDIPFVLHYKESPFKSIQTGTWRKLMEMYNKAGGVIFINEEMKRWYEQFIPERKSFLIVDGDLPKNDYFTDDFSPLLSEQQDDEIHTVCPGRLIGVEEKDVKTLSEHGIHIHIYADNYTNNSFNANAKRIVSENLHFHNNCTASQWVKEFSKYDAGWLHCFDSRNNNCFLSLGWPDLNIPARINVLVAAGLPIIQKENTGHTVAMRDYIKKREMGIFFSDIENLIEQLNNKSEINRLRNNVLAQRQEFTYDYHVPCLIDFFRKVIREKNGIK